MQVVRDGNIVHLKRDLRTDMVFKSIEIGMLGDPTSYLTREAMYSADEAARTAFMTIFDLYVANSEDSLLQAAAKHYGVTADILQDPEQCTEEQRNVMQIIRTNEFLVQLYADVDNNYRKALQILKAINPQQSDFQSLQQFRVFLIYFFTINPDISPADSGYFDKHPEAKDRLVSQYKRFKSFISANYDPKKKLEVLSTLEAFAKHETPDKADEIIEAATTSLLYNSFIPMLNGYPTNDLMSMSKSKMEIDGISGTAKYTKDGHTIILKSPKDLLRAIGVSSKKILDTATAYLTMGNLYEGTNVNPTATIPLMDYWKAQNYHVEPLQMDTEEEQEKEYNRVAENIKKLKQSLKEDLEKLTCVEWTGQGTGRNKGDFAGLRYISSYRVKGTTLYVNFDIDFAKYLVQAYVMQWSSALLRHKDSNSYVIGRKLLLHHSMDSNAAGGTDNTLSVKKLLEEAPDITTIEELKDKKRRDWKKQIKEKLELALNKNITTAPLLKRWEYRDPITGATYTPETASALSWAKYYTLMVDFVMNEEPDQTTRRTARAQEKAATIEAPKKKRGRPRKNKTE